MPRNGSGTYTLPQPPFVTGTVISSAAVNSDFSDIATALTGSLPRDGQAGMSGQLKAADGATSVPGITFNTEPTTGFTHATGLIGVSISGLNIGNFSPTGWGGSVSGSIIGANGATPVGTLISFAGASAPNFWQLCYGQAISRMTYAALFAVIGTAYGIGDGSTTFNVPDLRGRVLAGLDNIGGSAAGRLNTTYYGANPTVLGNGGGSQSQTLITNNLPAYTPTGTNAASSVSVSSSPTQVAPASAANQWSPGGGTSYGVTGAPITLTSTGSAVAQLFSGSAQGGTSTPLSIVQPAMVVNALIFAGA